MNKAGYGTKEYYEAWERYKKTKELLHDAERSAESEYENIPENRQRSMDLSLRNCIIMNEENRRYREKQVKIREESDLFSKKIEDLAKREYTISNEEFDKEQDALLNDINGSALLDFSSKIRLRRMLHQNTGMVSFDRKAEEIESKVANYSKNTDKLVEKLEGFETFSQSYLRRRKEYYEKCDELIKKYNEESDTNKKAEIEKEIDKLGEESRVAYTTSKERTRKDVEMTKNLLVESFGDTGSQIEMPKARNAFEFSSIFGFLCSR